MYEPSSQNDISCIPSEWWLNFSPNHKELSLLSDLNPGSKYGMYTDKVKEVSVHRWLEGNTTLQRPRPDHRSVTMHFYGGQSGNGTGLSPVLWFSPVSIVSPILHTHHHLNAILITPCKWTLVTHTAMDFWMSGSAIQRIIVTLHLSARPVHTTSVVNKQATHQVVLRVLWFSVSIISPMFYTLTEQTHQLPQQQHTKY